VNHFSSAPLKGRLQASPKNTILGWKFLPETNTLAYYKNPYITAVKSFIVQAPEGDRCDSYVIHLFKIKLNFFNVQNIDYETACGIHKMSYKNLTIILNVGML